MTSCSEPEQSDMQDHGGKSRIARFSPYRSRAMDVLAFLVETRIYTKARRLFILGPPHHPTCQPTALPRPIPEQQRVSCVKPSKNLRLLPRIFCLPRLLHLHCFRVHRQVWGFSHLQVIATWCIAHPTFKFRCSFIPHVCVTRHPRTRPDEIHLHITNRILLLEFFATHCCRLFSCSNHGFFVFRNMFFVLFLLQRFFSCSDHGLFGFMKFFLLLML
mmetsp:Transcript_50065/g.108773  ORF Transcript_50065/g.108773 Transcript_50065/m.108773 type:complete len:217 (-) Transcript_50065:142-792(-)